MTIRSATSPRDASQGAVPVIDIAGYDGGGLADKHAIARRIDEACRTVGFLVVAGHGVPELLSERTARAARAFFDLPGRDQAAVRAAQSASFSRLFRARVERRGLQPGRDRLGARSVRALHDRPRRPRSRRSVLQRHRDRAHRVRRQYLARRDRRFRAGANRLLPGDGTLGVDLDAAVRARARARRALVRRQGRSPHDVVRGAELSRPGEAAAPGAIARRPAFGLRQPDHPQDRGQAGRARDPDRRRHVAAGRRAARLLHRQYRRPDGAMDQRPLGIDHAPGGQPAARPRDR